MHFHYNQEATVLLSKLKRARKASMEDIFVNETIRAYNLQSSRNSKQREWINSALTCSRPPQPQVVPSICNSPPASPPFDPPANPPTNSINMSKFHKRKRIQTGLPSSLSRRGHSKETNILLTQILEVKAVKAITNGNMSSRIQSRTKRLKQNICCSRMEAPLEPSKEISSLSVFFPFKQSPKINTPLSAQKAYDILTTVAIPLKS